MLKYLVQAMQVQFSYFPTLPTSRITVRCEKSASKNEKYRPTYSEVLRLYIKGLFKLISECEVLWSKFQMTIIRVFSCSKFINLR